MAKKKLKNDGIFFTGKASDDVTGSQIYVKYGCSQFLIECGLHQSQSNDYIDSYRINTEKFKFKPNEIDYVFLCHAHIDHIGLLPRLVKEGFCGEIITTEQTAKIIKPLLLNSCAILCDEARVLSKRYKREYSPIYEEKDVYRTLQLVKTYPDYGKLYTLNNNISFAWLRNSHCVGAAQIRIVMKDDNKIKKLLYTSDIGSLKRRNHYVDDTEIPSSFHDIVIMESTYGNPKRNTRKKRSFDVKHLQTAVNTVTERGGTVILPCFSFSRTQEILTTLYEIYGQRCDFRTPIIIDSKLSCDICKLYNDILTGSDGALWKEIYKWKNVRFVESKDESNSVIADTSPKIIISSSGFCTNGRIVAYLKKFIQDRNSMVIFTGYTGDNPSYLSYRIKNYRNNKSIKINKEQVPNRADCISLSTFSSHANFDDLLQYGSSLNTNKLILVHGSAEAKKCLAEKLTDAISNNDKSYRVISSHRGMIINL